MGMRLSRVSWIMDGAANSNIGGFGPEVYE
jgi:hypothetical protein